MLVGRNVTFYHPPSELNAYSGWITLFHTYKHRDIQTMDHEAEEMLAKARDGSSPSSCMLQEVTEKIQVLVANMQEVKQRQTQLEEMVAGMIDSNMFADAEIDVVHNQISLYTDAYTKMQGVIHAKSELYEQHACSLEKMIHGRRDYLSKYDTILVNEPDIAKILVTHQTDMEDKLTVMHESINETPVEFTVMQRRLHQSIERDTLEE